MIQLVENIHFYNVFRFPKDAERRRLWVAAMRREGFQPTEYSRICCDHFDEECFDRTRQRIRLKRNAVPTVFNFPAHFEKVFNFKMNNN